MVAICWLLALIQKHLCDDEHILNRLFIPHEYYFYSKPGNVMRWFIVLFQLYKQGNYAQNQRCKNVDKMIIMIRLMNYVVSRTSLQIHVSAKYVYFVLSMTLRFDAYAYISRIWCWFIVSLEYRIYNFPFGNNILIVWIVHVESGKSVGQIERTWNIYYIVEYNLLKYGRTG